MMRMARVVAVARRDLASEFKGRSGWVLPAVMFALLMPVAVGPKLQGTKELLSRRPTVGGDVPEQVLALPDIHIVDRPQLQFFRSTDRLIVRGSFVPDDIRNALDGDAPPPVALAHTHPGYRFPNRAALFPLLASSALTGAVAGSVAGERTSRTLGVLLSAAITSIEIVLGKWAAWSFLGAVSTLFACVASVALGHLSWGLWILPALSVAPATVALGLWLSRRAGDQVSGTSVALRALPAILSIAAISAWLVGRSWPEGAALIPLGGALIAAGDTWHTSTSAPWIALASTSGFTTVMLAWTAQDLVQDADRASAQWGPLVTGGIVLVMCWLPYTLPLAWRPAGNPELIHQISPTASVMAVAASLLTLSFVRWGRNRLPAHPVAPASYRWMWLLPASAVLAASASFLSIPVFSSIAHAESNVPVLIAIGALLMDEWVFRGWLRHHVGDLRAGALFVLARMPYDPVSGVVVALTLTALARHTQSIVPGFLARMVCLVALTVA